MIFDPKRGGVNFFDIFDPPPPHVPQNLKKAGFKWGGVCGRPDQKTYWGMRLLDKIMILQGVE